MFRSLGVYGRFLGMVLPMSMLVFVLSITLFEWFNFSSARKSLSDKLNNATQIYSLLLAEPIANNETDKIKLFTSYLISDPDIASFRIVNIDGYVLEEFLSGKETYAQKSVSVHYASETDFRKLGTLYVAVSEDRIIADFQQRVRYELLLLTALIITVLISVRIAYRYNVGIPLDRLTQAIKKYKHEGIHKPIPAYGEDELSTVINTYNKMQEMQIKAREKLQQYHVELENEVKERTAELSHQANHDALTGLINRREFSRRLKELVTLAAVDQSQHALCYMDLDQFKLVNDTCGHAAGDQLLCQVSDLLKAHIRGGDSVGRLGGDEFAILLQNCSLDGASRVAEKIRQDIADFRFVWNKQSFRIGVSTGIVPIDQSCAGVDELLKQADSSCYIAKERGRNRIHIHHENSDEILIRRNEIRWTSHIQKALDKNYFELWCQPITSLRDDDTGSWCEMLIRMRMPDGSLHAPDEFLPSAERYGLAGKIDRWVLKHATSWLKDQDNQGIYKRCAINISGHTISDESFLEYALDILKRTGIKPSLLCFEITETAAISSLQAAKQMISSLKAKGCQFSLDDFGSGVSSFGYLRTLDVDYLKIDGSFVRNIAQDKVDREMVRTIHEVGQLLGMQTIAEFIETEETLLILKELGVNYAQGYFLGRPHPAIPAESESQHSTGT